MMTKPDRPWVSRTPSTRATHPTMASTPSTYQGFQVPAQIFLMKSVRELPPSEVISQAPSDCTTASTSNPAKSSTSTGRPRRLQTSAQLHLHARGLQTPAQHHLRGIYSCTIFLAGSKHPRNSFYTQLTNTSAVMGTPSGALVILANSKRPRNFIYGRGATSVSQVQGLANSKRPRNFIYPETRSI